MLAVVCTHTNALSIISSASFSQRTTTPHYQLSLSLKSLTPHPNFDQPNYNHHHTSLSLKIRMIRNHRILFFSLSLFVSQLNVSLATSAITAVLRDQVACTMCDSCDNPCQPFLSPPPLPPLPLCPPLPSPPPPSPPPPTPDPNCPPPPSAPSPAICFDSPPPPVPPSVPTFGYYSPPPPSPSGSGGGWYYPPPNGYSFPAPPPPFPILPCFPYCYYTPPPSDFINSSVPSAKHSVFVTLILLFLIMSFF